MLVCPCDLMSQSLIDRLGSYMIGSTFLKTLPTAHLHLRRDLSPETSKNTYPVRGTWFLKRFQKWWSPGSPSPPIGARPSSQGCQASSLALRSIGMVWPKQHGLATPSDMQSLLLRPPSIGSCRRARCWPGCLSDGKRPRLSRDLTLSH